MNLDERVALLEARNELSDLVARYCHLIDGRDFAGASELFDEDASFTVPDERTTGRDAVRAFLQTQLERYEFTYHYVHSQVIDAIEGDRAHGVVDAHAEHGEDGTCVLAGIRYVDAYRRAASGWRFQERELQIRYFLPWGKLGTRYHLGKRFSG
jgi:SnoaL-like protein